MATQITINLNDDDEVLLIKITDEQNAFVPGNPSPLTPAQNLRKTVRDWLRSHADRFDEQERLSLRQALQVATPEVKAQIKTLLEPFR